MPDTVKLNLVRLMHRFSDDTKCRKYLETVRWPNGVCCIRCDDMSVSRLRDYNKYECNSCRYQFSVTAGTIMHDSHLPLRKWSLAIYLLCESKKGISANHLKRTLEVAYKTAWYLCHRIREAMGNDQLSGQTLVGIVQVDETLVGGKRRGVGTGNRIGKTWVAGAVQRDGMVRLERIPNIRQKTLHSFVRRTIKDEVEAIYTDELKSYLGIGDHDTRHATVNHHIEEWVVGDVHTNSVEGVWSLLKRSIVGSFHKVSAKHLDAYLDELEWRFNNRDNSHIFRDTLRRIMDTDTLTYETLTAKHH